MEAFTTVDISGAVGTKVAVVIACSVEVDEGIIGGSGTMPGTDATDDAKFITGTGHCICDWASVIGAVSPLVRFDIDVVAA